MRAAYLAFLMLPLAACAPPVDVAQFAVADRPGAQAAYFSEYPSDLLDAAQEACSGPGDEIRRHQGDSFSCEMLLPPEATAGIILEYDGNLEDLPRFVFRFDTEERGSGYLVTTDNFVRVPQRDGGTIRIRLRDMRLERRMAILLTQAGGRPLA
ncbi:hypothetical protein AADZ90_013540 [Aestuariibius sp. 2305UL40-4]|uniref:hypothetical protein n=1 Tax=Aestuariibius violaceus TaxID=3234132 RepID=UPI00345E1F0B